MTKKHARALIALSLLFAATAFAETPANLVEASAMQGGLVAYLDCSDIGQIEQMVAGNKVVVHCLFQNGNRVYPMREEVRRLGLDGRVQVARYNGRDLPYVDNLVNLVIVEVPGKVSVAEMRRVLCPASVAFARDGKGWDRISKPRPENIDKWTHYLHDASGNAVAHDRVVGPPTHLQWKAGPLYARHHDFLASISSMVSDEKRVFYIMDEGPTTLMAYPAKWRLVARDAFNGTLLWKRPIEQWVDYLRRFRSGPAQLPRRLVADDGRVFVTLGLSAPVSALDAASGEIIRSYSNSEGTDEIVYIDGTLLLVKMDFEADEAAKDALRRGDVPQSPRQLLALDADTGRTLWEKDNDSVGGLKPLTLVASKSKAFYQAGDEVVCLRLKSGDELWRSRIAPETQEKVTGDERKSVRGRVGEPTMVVSEEFGVVYLAYGSTMDAFSAADGKLLWQAPVPSNFKTPPDLFLADGLVWVGMFATEGRDPLTGEIKRELDIGDLLVEGHHARCYRNKATDDYLIYSKHGFDFFDLDGGDNTRSIWTRGVCQYGVLPSNGLIYQAPNACGCYEGVMLRGFNALAATGSDVSKNVPDAERLQKGPAYGQVADGGGETGGWPSYRGGIGRSGSAKTEISASPETVWEAEVGSRLGPPAVSGGRLFVCDIDAGRVLAVDARNGESLWSFTAGGRVDTPPTIEDGKVIFGSHDGRVYCLRTDNGETIWSFLAAPRDKQIVCDEQLESVWPVHGSVLVQNGLAYFAAGRSSFLDGGVTLYALDATSGELRHKTLVANDYPSDEATTFTMGGIKSDILVGDGSHVFLKDYVFNGDLTRQTERQEHLFSHSGFADASWFYRTLWVLGYGTPQPLGNIYANLKYDTLVPYGQILCFDSKSVFGVQTTNPHRIQRSYFTGMSQCDLFAADRRPISQVQGETRRDDFPEGQDGRVRSTPPEYKWRSTLPFQARAMLLAKDKVFVAGWPEDTDSVETNEKELGGVLCAFSKDGQKLAEQKMESPPVFDGMAAAEGRLYIALKNGKIICLGEKDFSLRSK